MKRTLSLFLTLLFAFLFCGCQDAPLTGEKLGGIRSDGKEIYPEVFLHFDGQSVSFDEFRYYYLNYKNMYLESDEDYFSQDGAQEDLKDEVLQCLLDQWAVRFLAKEHKVSLNREEKEAVEASINEAIAQFGSEDAFLSDLHASFMSKQYYQSMMEYSSLYYKLFNTLFEDGGKEAYTDKEFYEFYQDHYLAIQQIFLPFGEGETKDSCQNTLALADSIRKQAENGKDFWSLVETFGKDDNMLKYPDGYYITEGQAEQVLYESAKKLKTGEISQPVVGQTGVYLMRRVEMKQARMDENRDIALFGYRDALDEWHPGEYDRVFRELYRKRAEQIKVEYSQFWDMVSTETVF